MSVAGIFLLTRHGDRQGFYQSPTTYTAKSTNLTVLGYSQEYKNGQDLRALYVAENATTPIVGMDAQRAEGAQMRIIADAGGEGSVIVDSANALLQGLYPPFDDTITLANGTNVTWSRTQLINVETVEADQDVWLEGWTECDTFQTRLTEWYGSRAFKAQAAVADPFFASMQSTLGAGRPATLENAWNLFDYLNVESIHNASVPVTSDQLAYARYWANYHEAGSFTDVDAGNIGNIAGQALLRPMLDSLRDLSDSSTGLKVSYASASYKPFLSLFRMWGLPSPLSDTVVDYASAAIVEVRSDKTVRLLFRNGTDGAFEAQPLFGSSNADSYPLGDFVTRMEPYAVTDLADWCDRCGTTDARGCSALAALNGTGGAGYASAASTTGHQRVSPVVAGVIGALVTLALVAFALGAWLLCGGMAKRSKRSGATTTTTMEKNDARSLSSTRAGSDHGADAAMQKQPSHTLSST